MRRKTYIEHLLDLYSQTSLAKKKDTVSDKLRGILGFYKKAMLDLSKKMTKSEQRANHALQEGGMTIHLIEQLLKNNDNVYKIARDFGQHLLKTKLDVPTASMVAVITENFGRSYLLEFPESITFIGPENEKYEHCIVTFGLFTEGFTLQICSPDANHPERVCSVAVIDVTTSGETVSECFDIFTNRYGSMVFPMEMVQYIAKCLLYIHSGEPDLKKESVTRTGNKKQKSLFHLDLFPFPIVRVGYSFHNREYKVDSTIVNGFFRWQPYGPGLSMVKLIWIDEHPRFYK